MKHIKHYVLDKERKVLKKAIILIIFLVILGFIGAFLYMNTSRVITVSVEQPTSLSINEVSPQIIQKPIKLIFVGDTMMDWSVKETVESKGPDYPFTEIKDLVSEVDYAVLNLETAVTNYTEKYPKLYNFRTNPEDLIGIKNAGFDMVTLANNHALDYKITGLKDTIENLNKLNIKFIGAGFNEAEAYQMRIVNIKNKKIGFLGFSRVLPSVSWYAKENRPGIASGYQEDRVINIIKESKPKVDYLFVYIHWGIEKNKTPEDWQINYAHKMIDAGADGIIGSHPHVLQTFSQYKGKPIAFSLGNFLFPDYVRGAQAETGIFEITINKEDITSKFIPFRIKADRIVKVENK